MEGKKTVKGEIRSFEDLEVYQKLCELHLEINRLSLGFPNLNYMNLAPRLGDHQIQSPLIFRKDGIISI